MAISDVPESARPISRTLFPTRPGRRPFGASPVSRLPDPLASTPHTDAPSPGVAGSVPSTVSQFSARLICLGFLSRLKSRDLPAGFVKLRLDSLLVLFPGLGSRPSLLLGLLCRRMLDPPVRDRQNQHAEQNCSATGYSGFHGAISCAPVKTGK